ncbi:MAG: hypothetical protein HY912_00795 [Desulfomonile tiedjei]|uniref:Uncharacterized protein n=1 Tax=Desulfomonile tiedjei TaxID=2358 RepID=A0A9D6UZP8_9BACT|nr:hypothetical protein [Desulfomonile tiedjei]
MKRVPAVVIWAVAFAYVESSLVEYLRALYYPVERGGFQFPILTLEQFQLMGDEHVRRLLIELGREASTLVMLAAVGIAAAENRREAWAHFMISFGVWDIFFYIWLKLFIDWPQGLMTWDLLFLVPLPWVSPVLCPVLVSLAMILAGLSVLYFERAGRPLEVSWTGWGLIAAGGSIVIASFCWDYKNIMAGGMPAPFNWPLFVAGFMLSGVTFLRVICRAR